jgi:hypothetical protein
MNMCPMPVGPPEERKSKRTLITFLCYKRKPKKTPTTFLCFERKPKRTHTTFLCYERKPKRTPITFLCYERKPKRTPTTFLCYERTPKRTPTTFLCYERKPKRTPTTFSGQCWLLIFFSLRNYKLQTFLNSNCTWIFTWTCWWFFIPPHFLHGYEIQDGFLTELRLD